MTDPSSERDGGISRRTLAGLGLAAGAAATLATRPISATASPTAFAPEAFGALNPALTYVAVDAFAFFPDSSGARVYADGTGVGPAASGVRLRAAVPLPAGSIIYELHVAYRNQPIVELWKRSLTSPTPYSPSLQQAVPSSGTAATASFNVGPITVGNFESVAVAFYASAADSVFGMMVGYTPPTQSFIPFTGGPPRILDTRNTGGKLNPSEERVIALGLNARSAVLNITVTDTENAGFLAAFPANIAWPNNSSVNWFGTGQNIANGVIVAMDGAGQIRIRAGANRTNVLIDRIGWLI